MRCAYCDLNDACLDRETDTPICLHCAERIWSPGQFKAAYMALSESWQAAPLRERRDRKVVTPGAIRYGGLEIVPDGSGDAGAGTGAGSAAAGSVSVELNDNDLLEVIYQWARSGVHRQQPASHALPSGLVARWRQASQESGDPMVIAVAIGEAAAKRAADAPTATPGRASRPGSPDATSAPIMSDVPTLAEHRLETRPTIH